MNRSDTAPLTHYEIGQRAQLAERLRHAKASAWEVYGRSIIIVCGGLALLMIGFGLMWRMMQPPTQPIAPTYTYHIERYGNDELVMPDSEAQSLRDTLDRINSGLQTQPNEALATPKPGKEKNPHDQFVVFRTYQGEGWQVVTGLRYTESNFEKPSEQYCYWTTSNGNSESPETRYQIGDLKGETTNVIWADNPKAENFKEYCKFLRV